MKIVSAVFVLLAAPLLRAAILEEVPQGARDELAAGETVVKSKDIQGAPWPMLTLYKVVDASPEVVKKLLLDYNAAPSYTPGLLKAEVLRTLPDGARDVRYTVKMPVIQKTSYVVRNEYSGDGKKFAVTWRLLESPFAKASDGSLRIEPYGGDKTLLSYTNLVIPKTNLVAGLKNQALNEAKATVAAIARESERRAQR